MAKKQTFHPRNLAAHDISLISTLGCKSPGETGRHHPEWSCRREGKDWSWYQVCRHNTFSLAAGEGFHSEGKVVAYTRWERYIKVNFLVCGRQTIVLDGFGQFEHERPEVFIVSGPPDMIKIDVENGGARNAGVALCLLREFFPLQLGVDTEELPEPLRAIAHPQAQSYALHRFPLSSCLLAATQSVLAVPPSVRGLPAYSQAKAVELMTLLVAQIALGDSVSGPAAKTRSRHRAALYDARELMTRRYAESLTLETIAREVGLNRMALTAGFRQQFGMSVHEWLQKRRMEQAYKMLQQDSYSIARIAEAVGYSHLSTFSTAFRAYFGHSPHTVRSPDSRADDKK